MISESLRLQELFIDRARLTLSKFVTDCSKFPTRCVNVSTLADILSKSSNNLELDSDSRMGGWFSIACLGSKRLSVIVSKS